MGADQLTDIQNLIGGNGNDTFTGGVEDNTFYGQLGFDSLTGGDGNDALYGNSGNDTLNGGDGDDTLVGGTGVDDIYLGYVVTENGDNNRDNVIYESHHVGTGTDNIHEFGVGAHGADVLNISDLLSNLQDGHNMNFYDLIRNGHLQITDDTTNTTVSVNIDADNNGTLDGWSDLAILHGIGDSSTIDAKHFITTHNLGVYTYNNQGSIDTTDSDDIIGLDTNTGGVTTTIEGKGGNDIIDIDGGLTGITVYGDNISIGESGDDVLVVKSETALNTNTLNAGDGVDRLVLDTSAPINFSAAGNDFDTNVNDFEILDLYGNGITNLQADDVLDITDADNVLFIEDSSEFWDGNAAGAGANTLVNFATADMWRSVDNTTLDLSDGTH